jgi:hypothetical protein
MKKPIIAIKLSPRNYAGLVALGNHVVNGLASNVHFVSPAIPTATLQAAVADLVQATAQWGPQGNRGNHEDLVDLRRKALVLANMLKAEAQYVQTTALIATGTDYAAMGVIISTSGFGLANARTPQGILEKVQDLHEFVSRKLNKNQVKLRWKKPLNLTSRSNVKEYHVLRCNSTDLTTAVEVGVSTKATFTDVNTSVNAARWTYWIVGYNSNGAGVVSDPITVDVLGV